MSRIFGFLYGVTAYGVFFAAFLYLIGFCGNLIVPKGIDAGPLMPTGYALAIDLALVLLFGLQHSIMARPAFKERLLRVVPASLERSTYMWAADAVLLLLLWQWRPMPQLIWHTEGALATALWLAYFAGFALVLLSTFVIDHFDLFGLKQVTWSLLHKRYEQPPFRVTYFYRFVRHPLYLGFLIAFWAAPTMTLGHFVFSLAMSAYILTAVRYEERDLEAAIGAPYRRYRERVPMLLPSPGKTHDVVKPARSV